MHPAVVVEKTPDKPAIVMAATGETLTYRQLEDRSNQGAQLFRSLGLKPGDGVALFMENNIRFLEICWAAQRAGLYYTCISSRLTAGEVEYIVRDCGAKVFIASHGLAKIAGEVAHAAARHRSASWSAARSRATKATRTPPARCLPRASPMKPPASTCFILPAPPGGPRACAMPLSGLAIDARQSVRRPGLHAVRLQREFHLSLARAALSRRSACVTAWR